MTRSDVIIRQYNTGNFAGKYSAHFISEKAKQVIDKVTEVDNYVIAGVQENIPKVERFCTNNQLHYELIILN